MDKVEYNRKRIIHMAKKYAENKTCPRCKSFKKKWKIVPLFEFGDPFMPSQIVLYCQSCKKYNETFAEAPDEQARAYAKSIKEGETDKGGFKKATKEEADSLIMNPIINSKK